MSPSPQKRQRKQTPLRTRSMDKTHHFRPEEEAIVVVMPTEEKIKPKKSVTFADVIAIDVETGEAFESYNSVTCSVREALELSLLPSFESDARESFTFYFKNLSRRNKKELEGDAGIEKKKTRSKNLILKGWRKIHHRLSPSLKLSQQTVAATA